MDAMKANKLRGVHKCRYALVSFIPGRHPHLAPGTRIRRTWHRIGPCTPDPGRLEPAYLGGATMGSGCGRRGQRSQSVSTPVGFCPTGRQGNQRHRTQGLMAGTVTSRHRDGTSVVRSHGDGVCCHSSEVSSAHAWEKRWLYRPSPINEPFTRLSSWTSGQIAIR